MHLEGDAYPAVGPLELAEELRHDDGCGTGRGANRQRAGEVADALRDHLVQHLLLEREQPLRAAVEAHPRLRRLDPAAGAVEELGAQTLLERAYLQGNGGLRDAELVCGLREGAPLDHRTERRQLARVHKSIL